MSARMRRLGTTGEVGPALKLLLWLTLLVLFAPLVVIVLMSFNQSQYGTLPFRFTLDWYRTLFTDGSLLPPTWLSVKLSVYVAVTTTLIGTATAIWLARRASRISALAVNGVLLAALTVPWLILGVGMLLVANAIGLGRGYFPMFLGLCAITLPYVVLTVSAGVAGISKDLEDAARSLGARPMKVYWYVLVPLALPSIAGGAMLAFMVSFNNFLVQYFLAPFGVQTLPLRIYTLVRVGYTPDLNALATLIVAVTLVIVVAFGKLGFNRSGVLRASRDGSNA